MHLALCQMPDGTWGYALVTFQPHFSPAMGGYETAEQAAAAGQKLIDAAEAHSKVKD